jgi:hypothetical protein
LFVGSLFLLVEQMLVLVYFHPFLFGLVELQEGLLLAGKE